LQTQIDEVNICNRDGRFPRHHSAFVQHPVEHLTQGDPLVVIQHEFWTYRGSVL
jgi:hypothetical protein